MVGVIRIIIIKVILEVLWILFNIAHVSLALVLSSWVNSLERRCVGFLWALIRTKVLRACATFNLFEIVIGMPCHYIASKIGYKRSLLGIDKVLLVHIWHEIEAWTIIHLYMISSQYKVIEILFFSTFAVILFRYFTLELLHVLHILFLQQMVVLTRSVVNRPADRSTQHHLGDSLVLFHVGR